jgi:hypothetical protein
MAFGEDGLAGLAGKAQITAQDVLAVRAAIYPDMTISPDEAEAVFAINDAAQATCPEWRMLFVEALTDYVVHQQQPDGYVDPAKAEWLIARITRDGRIKTDTELELLIHILERAVQAPDLLSQFALHEVVAMALAPERRAGEGPTLTADEVARLKRVLYADAGEGGGAAISRHEAAVLFALNEATRGRPNDPSWRDLFVHAVGAALMLPQGYVSPDRETALRRQVWLETPEPGVAAVLAEGLRETVQHPGQAVAEWLDTTPDKIGPAFASQHFLGRGADLQWEEEMKAKHDAADALAAPVTHDEADWLAAQIGHDGVLDDNEVALLLFVAETADSIHPSLQPLIAQAQARNPAAAAAAVEEPVAKPVVFGHRGVG